VEDGIRIKSVEEIFGRHGWIGRREEIALLVTKERACQWKEPLLEAAQSRQARPSRVPAQRTTAQLTSRYQQMTKSRSCLNASHLAQ
jgi:hypothetical protein